MKIIIYDIEITPILGWYYPPAYETRGVLTERDWHMMSFAWKELGKKKVYVKALCDYPGYKDDPYNDKALLQDLRNMLDDADLVIGHNSDRFDNKKANARFLFHNIEQPSHYDKADTLKMARAIGKFDSNSLNNLGKYLGLGEKVGSHAGLCIDCLYGNKKAWKAMKKYNKQDVTLTELVYNKLKAWAGTHPNMQKYRTDAEQVICRICAGINLSRRGYTAKATLWRQRYKCKDCGAWSQGTKGHKVKPYGDSTQT